MVKKKKIMKLPKPIIKFNSGMGAILCNKCGKIVKTNLTKKELNGGTDILYCETCGKEVVEEFIKSLRG